MSALWGTPRHTHRSSVGRRRMITPEVKVLKDFYQLPADKSVEHLSICGSVQLYQDQKNHSGVGLSLPHCLLSNLVFSKFIPLSFFMFAVTSQRAAGTRYMLSDHPVRFSTSDTQKKICREERAACRER